MPSAPSLEFPGRPLGRRERRAVTLAGNLARQDGTTVTVRLTDLSYDGCGVETNSELNAEERLELLVPGRGTIAATVRWCSAGRAGLTFEAKPIAREPLPRCTERQIVAAEVMLRRTGQPSKPVRMIDLSLKGCSIEVANRLEVDELVWIKVEGLEALEATVRWVAGHKAGLKYANAIHPAVFDMLLMNLEPSKRR